MSNKRKKRRDIQPFYCPFCQDRLWRNGGTKYHLYYQGKNEIQQKLNITSKKASFIATRNPVYVDSNVWLEEFFCDAEQQKVWLRVDKLIEGQLKYQLATENDWKRSVRTPHPDLPNSTVSEFTYRMSRQTGGTLHKMSY